MDCERETIRASAFGDMYRFFDPDDQDDYQDENPMESWIQPSRKIIKDVLEGVAMIPYTKNEQDVIRAATFARRGLDFTPSALTGQALRDQNFSQYPRETLKSMHDEYVRAMAEHPFERLIMDLIRREESFESALRMEHVEDQLHTKRFTAFDEKYALELTRNLGPRAYTIGNDAGDPRRLDIFAMLRSYEQGPEGGGSTTEEQLAHYARMTEAVNRQRRNFRLMRDWQGHRPW